MPYHISTEMAGCSGYAVVNSATGRIVPGGCHDRRSDAQEHMAALYANVEDASARAWARHAVSSQRDEAWAAGQGLGVTIPPSHWISVQEVCLRSGLSRATVYRAMEAGKLDYVQGPRQRRIDESDFDTWMAEGFPTG